MKRLVLYSLLTVMIVVVIGGGYNFSTLPDMEAVEALKPLLALAPNKYVLFQGGFSESWLVMIPRADWEGFLNSLPPELKALAPTAAELASLLERAGFWEASDNGYSRMFSRRADSGLPGPNGEGKDRPVFFNLWQPKLAEATSLAVGFWWLVPVLMALGWFLASRRPKLAF